MISPPNPNTEGEEEWIHHDGAVAIGACILALLVAMAKPLPLDEGYLNIHHPAPLESSTHIISDRVLPAEDLVTDWRRWFETEISSLLPDSGYYRGLGDRHAGNQVGQQEAMKENVKIQYRPGAGEGDRDPAGEYA